MDGMALAKTEQSRPTVISETSLNCHFEVVQNSSESSYSFSLRLANNKFSLICTTPNYYATEKKKSITMIHVRRT